MPTLILNNLPMILTVLLVVSEALASICQLAFPDNKGIGGILAGAIKVLQTMGAKDPVQK